MVDWLPNEIEIEIEKQDRVRRDLWSAKVSSLSRVTPKSRTLDEKVVSPPLCRKMRTEQRRLEGCHTIHLGHF